MFRLAVRNLARNGWRSTLTAAGIAVAVALLVWSNGMMGGMLTMMVRGATGVQIGQAQIHNEAYAERPGLYRGFDLTDDLLVAVEGVDGVQAASPRVHVYGLLGHETTSQIVGFVGVDPTREAATTLVDDAITEGRWLAAEREPYPAPREIVIGTKLAELLEVGVGAELVVFLQAADGSLGNDLLKVVGIVDTGNTAVDRTQVFLPLDDAQYLAAMEGRVHEIALALDDVSDTAPTVAAIQAAVDGVDGVPPSGDDHLLVRSWAEVIPEMYQMVEYSRSSNWVIYMIIFTIAALGVLNAQRMSALERRREFGVLLSIGLSPPRLGAMLVMETVLLTALGAAAGAAIGLSLNLWFRTHGLDLAALSSGGSFEIFGVAFGDRIYFDWTAADVLTPTGLIIGISLLCGLWPAWWGMRLNAIQAVAGRT